MSETKHTPGPWHVGDHRGIIVYDVNGIAIADAKTFHGKHGEGAAEANARLIAAAPELLEALIALVEFDPSIHRKEGPARYAKAREAISKATT